MANHLTHFPRYEIHSQNRCESIVIKNVLTQSFFIKTAQEILTDIELLSGFLPHEAALIGFIAGMAINTE